MTYQKVIRGAFEQSRLEDVLFHTAIRQSETFLKQTRNASLIDSYEGHYIGGGKKSKRYVFKIDGPESAVRYANASLLAGTFNAQRLTEKGIVKPRKKTGDYYLHIDFNRENDEVSMSFSVRGHRVPKDRKLEPLITDDLSRFAANPFFHSITLLMVDLQDTMSAKAEQAIKRRAHLEAKRKPPSLIA